LPTAEFLGGVVATLTAIQGALLVASRARLDDKTFEKRDYAGLREVIDAEAGWVRAPWCGAAACEGKVKDETKATIRCIPLSGGAAEASERCAVCGEAAKHRVLFAKAY